MRQGEDVPTRPLHDAGGRLMDTYICGCDCVGQQPKWAHGNIAPRDRIAPIAGKTHKLRERTDTSADNRSKNDTETTSSNKLQSTIDANMRVKAKQQRLYPYPTGYSVYS